MAKRHRNNLVTTSFHFLIKTFQNADDPENPIEEGFTNEEFQRVLNRISDPNPLDVRDPTIIANIKSGIDLPFSGYDEVQQGLHFGNFDGAYYGQQYRNNMLGVISADSLNLRPFNYLITRLRGGRILVGVSYNGQYGDYEGIRRCLMHILSGNYKVSSKTVTSIADEIGDGIPIEIKLSYRNANERPERRSLFGTSGVIAIKATEYGDNFAAEVIGMARSVRGNRGNIEQQRRSLAEIVKQGQIIELDDEDIIGCTALIRENGRTRTIYILGANNNFATKFRLNVELDGDGIPSRDRVQAEMIRVMRERVVPLLE